MHITVRRNAYGRQLGSFNATGYMSTTPPLRDVPMVFIRAPYIESVGEDVDILATLDGNIIAAKQGKQIVTAFHPELTSDTRIHELFMRQV
jgi:5'-phosphate synthase pdxT subunit